MKKMSLFKKPKSNLKLNKSEKQKDDNQIYQIYKNKK